MTSLINDSLACVTGILLARYKTEVLPKAVRLGQCYLESISCVKSE